MSVVANERSAGRRLTDAFLERDAPAMVAQLAPDAVFHSPVADYEDRDRIGAVLTAVTQVVAAPRRTRLIEGSDETLLAFTAELDGQPRRRRPAGERWARWRDLSGDADGQAVGHAPRRRRPDEGAARSDGPGPDRAGPICRGASRAPITAPASRSSSHVRRRAAGQACIATRTRRPSSCTRAGSTSRSTARRSRREAGQIVIAPPGSAHKFVNVGDAPAHMTNIHPRPRMSQEDLE